VNIVIPMAGRGSRFAQVGVTTPKPLIDVLGKPMYAWAVDSLPLSLARRLIFVCLREHLADRGLADDIRSRYAQLDPMIIALDAVTRGQSETVLAAKREIDADEPLLVYNADTYERNRLTEELPRLPSSVVGLWSVFSAPGDKWSFARVDERGRVVETAEKKRISDHASTGLYWFRRGRDFVRIAEAAIDAGDRSGGEFYVAPLYNRLIAEGGEVRVSVADEVWVLGTPEDLAHFHAHAHADERKL
jgi:dTDP-glucose pyrophosphorylase